MRGIRFGMAAAMLAAVLSPAAAEDGIVTNASVTASISGTEISLCNPTVCRRWRPDRLATTAVTGPGVSLAGEHPDFSLTMDGLTVTSDAMNQAAVRAEPVVFGVRITWTLLSPLALVTRSVELHAGAAVFETRTRLNTSTPGTLDAYTLDEVAAPGGAGTIHAFRAGADWREPGWEPSFSIGPAHTGDWREATTEPRANGEWLSVELDEQGAGIDLVLERRNYASSVMSFSGGVATAGVDLSHDLIYFGPFEEAIHAESESGAAGRARALVPGRALDLERSYLVVAPDRDHGPWEFAKYLTRYRLAPYRKAVTFNTNRIDTNAISTGAKDDVNFERMTSLVAAAREMGVDTFILDDGWQAISGDWCPDSDDCPEPRRGSSPKFEARFPDARFDAVRVLLAGEPGPADDIDLGLWMTPMEFHPASAAFERNPQWACAPVGHGTAAISVVDPDGGSNEAGLGVWNPLALGVHPDDGRVMRLIDYIEERTLRMIEVYGARYFKFDFLVWIDCGGVVPADMYDYHDAFVAMLDRIQELHPDVTLQIDETNDYRMFPFESVVRGPSWFQNGAPPTEHLLHNIWNLSPYVPGWSLGQHALDNTADRQAKGIDMLMAAAMPSHITFWAEIDTELDTAQRAQIKRWTDFYRAHPGIAGYTMPLLEDPRAGGWTALQSWDLDEGEGYVLAFNQSSVDPSRSIALRGLDQTPDGALFEATRLDPADGSAVVIGTFTAAQLRAGLPVTIGAPHGYAIVRVQPAGA